MRIQTHFRMIMLLGLTMLATRTNAQDTTTAGELVVEPPTLHALGFEWYIDGDDNRNAAVSLEYRESGAQDWQTGLPLLRIQREEMRRVYNAFDYTAPNMFAGSLFDLAPDTEYEVRLTLTDPDNDLEAMELVQVRTRPVPMPAADGRTFHVYPIGYEGEKQEPAFTGLLNAYYTSANGADWFNAFPPRVQPGDTIMVHAGEYKADRYRYANPTGLLFDGTYRLRQGGTREKPIAIVAAGDGEVIFDGNGNHVLFDVMAADYLYFEGITIRNTEVGIQAGYKDLAGAEGLVVKNSRFEQVGRGIYTDWSGSKDFYIADNVFIGKSHPDRLEGWIGRTWQGTPGFPTPVISELAIKVYGSGHVITHNYVANFHDGIDHATYGAPDGNPDIIRERMPVSIDITNNDITNVDDNCIETDGAMHNVRVLRNRCFNQAHRALSVQPGFSGPVYFIRNVVYHAPESGATKFTANSAGILVYHNTFTTEVLPMGPVGNLHYRNNLILGQGAAEAIFGMETFTAYSSSDYNGFMVKPEADISFSWTAPAAGKLVEYGELEKGEYASLAQYSAATSQDSHSVLVDYGIFVNVPALGRDNPQRLYDPAAVDFSLKAGSAAVDAGIRLPNINDGFSGSAPDLGAYERGQPLPHYGPRR
ncbi:MAG: hypothetical protein ACO3R5_00030 [Pseudohongiellaceae bacterium]